MKRVAVIGFGFMGITHSQNILKNRDLELAAIVEKDEASVVRKIDDPEGNISTGETDVNALKKVPVYTSLKTCLEKETLDAVHICVHTNLHYAVVKEALESGLHVLVEKPFLLDVEKGEELIRLAQEKNLILMVAHVVRFMSPYKKLYEIIHSETYGKLKFISLSRFSGLPLWGQWKDKQKDFGSSGGALFDLIIHDIDFAAFVFGKAPDKIESKVLPGKLSKHDYLNANWKYHSKNVDVKIEGGNIFHSNFPFEAGYKAVFEKATVSFSTNDADLIYIDSDTERVSIDANDLGDGYFNEIALFAESIKTENLPEKYSPKTALDTIKLCYRHLETQEPVR
ncbi:Gfo/Idh/MocA family oxidoreductase [Prolixibacteraceae bacterium Z1-6]|uniref:Gfo/Idh/MocA family oxidoreductase n=1 Tax=Draconibacterium aestuarii TaxID=2998507 RepID=A0A9X3F9Q6_9BACT|nr:Gfo/Idh/MocA family oxidoreductase [Prolixibacteraceae bacterium Z1-6]